MASLLSSSLPTACVGQRPSASERNGVSGRTSIPIPTYFRSSHNVFFPGMSRPSRYQTMNGTLACDAKVCPTLFKFWVWTDEFLGRSFWPSKTQRRMKIMKLHKLSPEASSPTDEDAPRHVTGSLSLSTSSSSLMSSVEGISQTLAATVQEVSKVSPGQTWNSAPPIEFLSLIVVGATGELARNKIFPALFALFYSGYLPENVAIFGFSRSHLDDDELRAMISEKLTCRIDTEKNCSEKMKTFLSKVFYQSGGYDTCDGMTILDKRMRELEGDNIANRVFYLSVPQDVVLDVATCVSATAQSLTGWSRVIIEKPFGHDADSSATMTQGLLSVLNENQIYRIDQLLGKELIENLTVLRFSNLIFEPLWSRTYIQNVQMIHSEDWGIGAKGRAFDQQGIIRDIVQSHILQLIALFAMEPPVSLNGEDVRNEKVKVLRSMRKPSFEDVVLGQYKASISKDGKSRIHGYLEEDGVAANSRTSTFMSSVLYIDNARWDGVPFLIKAGIGLIKHAVEIRILFRQVPGNLYSEKLGHNMFGVGNELILRVQPDEAILLKINNKVPGLGLQLDSSELNLLYRQRYDLDIPDSYERLILDVIDGDNHLFLRGDELQATWDLLTPLLDEIEKHKIVPESYTFGGRGPIGAYYLGAKHSVRWADD